MSVILYNPNEHPVHLDDKRPTNRVQPLKITLVSEAQAKLARRRGRTDVMAEFEIEESLLANYATEIKCGMVKVRAKSTAATPAAPVAPPAPPTPAAGTGDATPPQAPTPETGKSEAPPAGEGGQGEGEGKKSEGGEESLTGGQKPMAKLPRAPKPREDDDGDASDPGESGEEDEDEEGDEGKNDKDTPERIAFRKKMAAKLADADKAKRK